MDGVFSLHGLSIRYHAIVCSCRVWGIKYAVLLTSIFAGGEAKVLLKALRSTSNALELNGIREVCTTTLLKTYIP